MQRILTLVILLFSIPIVSIAQVKMPAPSPTQTLKQDFGLSSIELTYSRPSAKDRKIFGDLVPYNKVWRTGANAATKIIFKDAVELGGKKVDTGTYVLYSIPGVDSWEIIINKGLSNWGTDGYKESEDVARFKVSPMKLKNRAETFTMQFSNIMAESCNLDIMWDKTIVSIPVTVNIKDKVRAQLNAALQTDKKPYWQAAQFFYEYDKNLPKALEYVTKATEANDKAFWIFIYKAKIQHDMGDNAGAMESSKKSLDLAKAAKNDDYIKMNMDLQKKLK